MKYLFLIFWFAQLHTPVHKELWEDIKHAFVAHNDETVVCYPKTHRNIYLSFTSLVITLAGATYYGLRVKQKTNRQLALQNEQIQRQKRELEQHRDQLMELNEEINQQKEEITAQRDDIEEKSLALHNAFSEIEKKNENIISSINYARRIQHAMLPTHDYIKSLLPDSFILFEPRDIVSGDFYWISEVKMPGDVSKIVIAAADCTGHGVPGAFMSMIGNDLLSEIVNEKNVTCPNMILEQLHEKVRRALKQQEGDSRDGMDIALCVVDRQARTLEYAGAKNPLYFVQADENGQPQFIEIKGDKNPIGGFQKESERIFTKHCISIASPTTIYLCSDGFQDQFGGTEGRKFMTRRFRELLFSLHDKPMPVQKEMLETALSEWMGREHEQIDDVMVIGVKFN